MKTSFAKVAGGLALFAASSVAMASVVNTPHNLGAGGEGNHTNGTTEICIFCHTPHGGDQDTFAPIWNRATATNVTYIRFSDLGRLTFDAKEAPVGSVSAACLSCHDGTQAIDAVINTSGLNSNASTMGTWDGEAQNMSLMAAPNGHWYNTGTGSRPAGKGDMVFLGTDLSNDHPISMQYGGGGIDSTSPSNPTNDPDFAQPIGAATFNGGTVLSGNAGGLIANNGAGYASNAGAGATTTTNTNNINGGGGAITGVAGSGTGAIMHDLVGGNRWWVETTGDTSFTSEDFPLYTRLDVTGSAIAQPTVECGTCHDPHSGNSTFLRLVGGNKSSAVCLTCHAK